MLRQPRPNNTAFTDSHFLQLNNLWITLSNKNQVQLFFRLNLGDSAILISTVIWICISIRQIHRLKFALDQCRFLQAPSQPQICTIY